MQCINPLKASFTKDGTVTFSKKQADISIQPFEFPCRKCLACRLNQAREKSIRAIHEAQSFGHNNIFLTLTYSDEHLESDKLIYYDFQAFMKRLRYQYPDQKISYMVTGEYGDKTKRPHWHALLFNFRPEDEQYKYSTDRGDKVYDSKIITDTWSKGISEYGEVNLDSAGYVARYAAKKLTHGSDNEHDFHPIHRTSCKHALGRKWIEKNYRFVLENGFINLPNGEQAKIPRYYLDWAKSHVPDLYETYVTQTRKELIKTAEKKKRQDEIEHFNNICSWKRGATYPMTRPKVRETILKSKFKQLQERLKL